MGNKNKFQIPQELKPLLQEMAREVMINQPSNIYEFLAKFTEAKLARRGHGTGDECDDDAKLNLEATKIQAAFRGYSERKKLRDTKHRLGPDGKELSMLTTLEGKSVKLTTEGDFTDVEDQRIVGGSVLKYGESKILVLDDSRRLIQQSGMPVSIEGDGAILDSEGIPIARLIVPARKSMKKTTTTTTTKTTTVYKDGKPVSVSTDETDEIIHQLMDVTQNMPQVTSGNMPEGAPGSRENLEMNALKLGTESLDVALAGLNLMQYILHSLEFVGDEGVTIDPNGIVRDKYWKPLAPGKILKTVDGREFKVGSNGQLFDSDGRAVKPPEQLLTADGNIIRISPTGLAHDKNGKPLMPGTKVKLRDGTVVVVAEDGTLRDSFGHPFPGHISPGAVASTVEGFHPEGPPLMSPTGETLRITPSGEHVVNTKGEPVPPGTQVMAGERHFTVDDNGKLVNLDGSRVPIGHRGEILDGQGRLLGTAAVVGNPSDQEIRPLGIKPHDVVEELGKVTNLLQNLRNHIDAHHGKSDLASDALELGAESLDLAMALMQDMLFSERQNIPGATTTTTKYVLDPSIPYYTEDGKLPVQLSPSKTAVDKDCKPLAHGTKVRSNDGKNTKYVVDTEGKLRRLGPDEERILRITQSGELSVESAKLLPEGTIVKTLDGKEMVVGPNGELLNPNTNKPSSSNAIDSEAVKLIAIDASQIAVSEEGHLIDPLGQRLQPGAKVIVDGKTLVVDANGELAPCFDNRTGLGGLFSLSEGGDVSEFLPNLSILNGFGLGDGGFSFGCAGDWIESVRNFLTTQLDTIRRVLNGEISVADAQEAMMVLTVAFVAGTVVGYAIYRSASGIVTHGANSAGGVPSSGLL